MQVVTKAIHELDAKIAHHESEVEKLTHARKALAHLNSFADGHATKRKYVRKAKRQRRKLSAKAILAIRAGQKRRWAKLKLVKGGK